MLATFLFAATVGFGSIATAQFGLTDNDDTYVVNAGSTYSLVVTIDKGSCDVTSIVYRGTELQYPSPYTHIGSGLGTATASAQTIDRMCSAKSEEAKVNHKTRPICKGHLRDRYTDALHCCQVRRGEHVYGHLNFSRTKPRRAAIRCSPRQ